MTDAQPTPRIADLLVEQGVFKGAYGLEGLLNAAAFWERQPYGTRLYYGDGIADYLHRSVLAAAISALAQKDIELREMDEENTRLLTAAAEWQNACSENLAAWAVAKEHLAQKDAQLAGVVEKAATQVFLARCKASEPDSDDLGVAGWLKYAEDQIRALSLVAGKPEPK